MKAIDLNSEFSRLRSNDNFKLLEWINNDSFYSNSRDNIQSTVSKIVDHYYDQLKGSWSLNNEVWKLISDYAEIDYFINENYIIYDKYSEYKELTNLLTEGLFASHAINESHNSRLEYFDDWLISKLIVYGSSEVINKFFLRYKLKKIYYKKTSYKGDSFIELINNFFNNNRLREAFTAHCEQSNRVFWEFYNTLFCNILTLTSICDFDDSIINDISNKLVEYLNQETYIFSYNIKYIRYFLYRVGAKVNPSTLEKFFHLAIDNPKYHDEKIFETISDVIHLKQISFDISATNFISIKAIAFEKCETCKTKHEATIIIPIYLSIKNERYKLEIVELINNKLRDNFDFYLFYFATLYEIIDSDEILFSKFIDVALEDKEVITFRSAFTKSKDKRYDKVNELLNLCFKLDLNTDEDRFKIFKTFDDYYGWLVDMKNFEYEKFQPKWIIEYPTRYYYKKISKSEEVKTVLNEYLKQNPDIEIQTGYFNIYLRESWNAK